MSGQFRTLAMFLQYLETILKRENSFLPQTSIDMYFEPSFFLSERSKLKRIVEFC